jgi:hypothetical protein
VTLKNCIGQPRPGLWDQGAAHAPPTFRASTGRTVGQPQRVPLLWLAQQYAHEQGVRYTRSAIESIRRAVHNLEKQGEVKLDYELIPSGLTRIRQRTTGQPSAKRPALRTHSGRWRRMLFVAPADGVFEHYDYSDPFGGPHYPDQKKSPPRDLPVRLVTLDECADCGVKLLNKEGLDTKATFRQVAASVVTAVGVAEGWEDEVVKNDLCYGCWLRRQPSTG